MAVAALTQIGLGGIARRPFRGCGDDGQNYDARRKVHRLRQVRGQRRRQRSAASSALVGTTFTAGGVVASGALLHRHREFPATPRGGGAHE